MQKIPKIDNLSTILTEVFDTSELPIHFNESSNGKVAEEQLYGSDFVSDQDLRKGNKLRHSLLETKYDIIELKKWSENCTEDLALYMILHNRPGCLDAVQKYQYRDFVKCQLTDSKGGLMSQLRQMDEAKQKHTDTRNIKILHNLTQYIEKLRETHVV